MKKIDTLFIITILAALFLSITSPAGAEEPYFLIDDFSSGKSTLGTEWEDFTDKVMGGKSEMNLQKMSDDGDYIRMQGRVSLEKNGGFIQTRLKLASGFSSFNGSPYEGIRLLARGVGSGYYIILRTSKTLLPWKYFSAPVQIEKEWSYIDIPWTAFGADESSSKENIKVNKLKSIAVVAYGKEFDASIDVKEIGLY